MSERLYLVRPTGQPAIRLRGESLNLDSDALQGTLTAYRHGFRLVRGYDLVFQRPCCVVEILVWDEAEGIPLNTFAYKAADLYRALAVLDQYDPCAHIPPDIDNRDCIHEQVRRRFRERMEHFKHKAIERFGDRGSRKTQ
jgi:hypothetical protein